MKLILFSVNIENIFRKEFCLLQQNDKVIDFIDNSSTRYVLSREDSYKLSLQKHRKILNFDMDVYMYNILENALKFYDGFRLAFINYAQSCDDRNRLFNIDVYMPKMQIIDKRGNKLFEISCLERRELDHAMAWFSTLGGAFSALGDKIEYCAIMAGKISQQQFLLALRLGDPNLVSRCKLYMALSLIQQKKFFIAKQIIKSQYIVAKKEYERDKRLLSMCQGIWTKWRYDKKQAKINGEI